MKNPFKLKSILSAGAALAIGGGANVLADYARANVEALSKVDDTYYNAGKVVVGAVGSTMISGKKYGWLKSAFDGIPIVGASDLIKPYILDGASTTAGLPEGTIGRLRLGQRNFRMPARRGVHGAPFMEA